MHILRLTIDGNQANNPTGGAGVILLNYRVLIRDVVVKDVRTDGIVVSDMNAAGRVINNTAVENRIESTRIVNPLRHGILVLDTLKSRRLTDGYIENSVVEGAGGTGMRIERAAGWFISGNRVSASGGTGMYLDQVWGTFVRDNVIDGFGGGASTGTRYGVQIINLISGRPSDLHDNVVTTAEIPGLVYRYYSLRVVGGISQSLVLRQNLAFRSAGAGSSSVGYELIAPSGATLSVRSSDNTTMGGPTQYTTSGVVKMTNAPGTNPTPNADVRAFTADDTWVKPLGGYKTVRVVVIGGGGGGASGRPTSLGTVGSGGGGGGGGALSTTTFPYSAVPSSVPVQVGVGGAGAPGDATAGASGNPGTRTSFGALLSADGGAGGVALPAAAGPAAGGVHAGGTGGLPATNGTDGGTGGKAASGGGGAGGGITVFGVPCNGGNGGGSTVTSRDGGLGGLALLVDGANADPQSVDGEPNPGPGGGGGAASILGAGGAGGAGARWGGGGGGGGASLAGFPSGSGGGGASGYVLVITS